MLYDYIFHQLLPSTHHGRVVQWRRRTYNRLATVPLFPTLSPSINQIANNGIISPRNAYACHPPSLSMYPMAGVKNAVKSDMKSSRIGMWK